MSWPLAMAPRAQEAPNNAAASASESDNGPTASAAVSPGGALSPEATLTVADLARLAEHFESAEQPFLGYAFHMAHYELSADSSARLASGTAALNGAFFAGRYAEAEHALRRLATDFPDLRRTFRWQYAVLLLQDGRFEDAALALDAADLQPADRDTLGARLAIAEALLALHESDHPAAIAHLEPLDTDAAFGPEGTAYQVAAARIGLRDGPPQSPRSPGLAAAMSAAIPGSGQLYSGHVYDAAQAFGLTTVLGYGAYSAWRYELDAGGPTGYVLPALSTLVAGAFYLSNVRGAHASARRFNAYREARFYRDAIDGLTIAVGDGGWMLGVRLTP
ncbi:hypothetical protein [Rubricoccus marinus]|nr:hypothetical protein [Rubricoccus marinus]